MSIPSLLNHDTLATSPRESFKTEDDTPQPAGPTGSNDDEVIKDDSLPNSDAQSLSLQETPSEVAFKLTNLLKCASVLANKIPYMRPTRQANHHSKVLEASKLTQTSMAALIDNLRVIRSKYGDEIAMEVSSALMDELSAVAINNAQLVGLDIVDPWPKRGSR